MKNLFLTIITLFLYPHVELSAQNRFSKSNDTLIIKTKKEKGDGLFQLGVSPLMFTDTETLNNELKYPQNIKNIKLAKLHPEFSNESKNFIYVINGIKNEKHVFIVDENFNKDLTDDPVRPSKNIKWNRNDKLVKCNYTMAHQDKILNNYSWLRMGLVHNDFYVGRSEHLKGVFNIDGNNYELHLADPFNGSFTYNIDPILALVKTPNIKKDTISNRDLLKVGEFLNLNEVYYKFNSISKNGEFITLIKERNFNNKIGTQVGMIAPSFEAVSTLGDTINNKKLNNKITLIANSCGCGGDKESTQAYYDIKNNYKDFNVIHVDSKINTELDGIHIDVENSYNKEFYKNYRKQYCSRIAYIIGKDNRITDKFEITDWKPILQKTYK